VPVAAVHQREVRAATAAAAATVTQAAVVAAAAHMTDAQAAVPPARLRMQRDMHVVHATATAGTAVGMGICIGSLSELSWAGGAARRGSYRRIVGHTRMQWQRHGR